MAGLNTRCLATGRSRPSIFNVDLGTVSAFADSDTAPGFGVTLNSSSRLTLHTARLGLNYRFDWGGPVVARY